MVPTQLLCNDTSEIMMENSNKPTESARQIDVHNFALQYWIELKQVILEHIRTYLTLAHTYTKALLWFLHNRHTGRIMGEYGYTFMHR